MDKLNESEINLRQIFFKPSRPPPSKIGLVSFGDGPSTKIIAMQVNTSTLDVLALQFILRPKIKVEPSNRGQ